ERGVAHRVAPVDQSLLEIVVHSLEPGRRLGEGERALERTVQRIGQLVIMDVGANAPIGAPAGPRLEGVDYLPLAQRPHLIVDEIEDPVGVPRPISLGLLLLLRLAAGIADEHRLIAFPYRLQTEIVVYTAIRKY